jgi:hypothetical protein
MANNFDAATDRILAGVMMAFRNNSVMPGIVTRDYDKMAMKKGKSVDVVKPMPMTATDVVPSPNMTAGQDLDLEYVPIKLNYWKEVKFQITDKEIAEIMDGVIPAQIEEAGIALANAVDQSLLRLAVKFWGVAGVAGQTPFKSIAGIPGPYTADQDITAAKNARKILNRQLAPDMERYMVLDVEAEGNAGSLPQFQNTQASGDKDVVTKGVIGEKLGFRWLMNQQIGRHVTGAAGAYVVSANALQGSSTLAVGGGGGVPKEGDVIYLAGDSQSYVLAPGSTTTAWNILPKLRLPIASGTTVQIVPSHTMNIAMNKRAIALVVRTLEDTTEAPNTFMKTFIDNLTKLPMRLEYNRGNKMGLYSVDMLWGAEVLRGEFGCRVMGE